MPAPHDQPRWPAHAPPDPEGHGQGGRWRSRNQATHWVEEISRRIVGTPGWADRGRLARLALQRPRVAPRSLTGGAVAQTDRLEYPDGSVLVRKRFTDDEKGQRRASAEYLASLVAEAVGASAPAVVKDPTDPEHSVLMGFVSGDSGLTHTGSANAEQWGQANYWYAHSDGGLRIGLLDILISNHDRHAGNWLMSDEIEDQMHPSWSHVGPVRRPIAIDHSETLNDERLIHALQMRVRERGADPAGGRGHTAPMELDPYMGFTSPWLRWGEAVAINDQVFDSFPVLSYRDRNPLHPDDVDELRGRLGALRAKFEGEDMLPEWEAMMRRFEHVARRAGGTVRLFPDA